PLEDPLFHLITGMGQLVLRGSLIGSVARDLGETAHPTVIVFEPHEHAVRPEARAVLAHMKTPIGRPALGECDANLFLRRTLPLILGSKNQVPALADGFVLAPPEDALRAVAPISNDIPWIEQEHRVIARAFDQHAE